MAEFIGLVDTKQRVVIAAIALLDVTLVEDMNSRELPELVVTEQLEIVVEYLVLVDEYLIVTTDAKSILDELLERNDSIASRYVDLREGRALAVLVLVDLFLAIVVVVVVIVLVFVVVVFFTSSAALLQRSLHGRRVTQQDELELSWLD